MCGQEGPCGQEVGGGKFEAHSDNDTSDVLVDMTLCAGESAIRSGR